MHWVPSNRSSRCHRPMFGGQENNNHSIDMLWESRNSCYFLVLRMWLSHPTSWCSLLLQWPSKSVQSLEVCLLYLLSYVPGLKNRLGLMFSWSPVFLHQWKGEQNKASLLRLLFYLVWQILKAIEIFWVKANENLSPLNSSQVLHKITLTVYKTFLLCNVNPRVVGSHL